jgi:hypothetical protein
MQMKSDTCGIFIRRNPCLLLFSCCLGLASAATQGFSLFFYFFLGPAAAAKKTRDPS